MLDGAIRSTASLLVYDDLPAAHDYLIRPYGVREYGARDLAGHLWYFHSAPG
jgi:hypothetical protein